MKFGKWVLAGLGAVAIGAASLAVSSRAGRGPADTTQELATTPHRRAVGARLTSGPAAPRSRAGASSPAAYSSAPAPGYVLEPIGTIAAPWFSKTPPVLDHPEFSAVEIGDVTGDGRNDLVVVGRYVSTDHAVELLVYAQMPDGRFDAPVRYPVRYDGQAFLALGDFNEDGVQDVVVELYKGFMLFASDGEGGLVPSIAPIYPSIDLGTMAPALPMDVNLDGHLDLVFFLTRVHAGGSGGFPTEESHSRLVVHFGDGLGGFAGKVSIKTFGENVYDTEVPKSLAAGDLDNDGTTDLAVRVERGVFTEQRKYHLVRVFLNKGGMLEHAYDIDAVMEVGSTFSSLVYLAIGDFNQDGLNDLAGSPGSMDMRMWVLHQSPSGRFDVPPHAIGSLPVGISLEVADMDGNGREDLLVAHDGYPELTYHLQSVGPLAAPQAAEVAGQRRNQTTLAVGDLDGDGCMDAAVAGRYLGLDLLRGTNCRTGLPTLAVCRTGRDTNPSLAAAASAQERGVRPLRRSPSGEAHSAVRR